MTSVSTTSRRLIYFCLAAALLLGSSGARASESPDGSLESSLASGTQIADTVPIAIGNPISEEELQDIKTMASQSGMTLQAAIDRYAWNHDFAVTVARIREAAPDAFAAAEIVDAGHAWIAFSGRATEAARELVDAFSSHHDGIAVEVRTDVGFTEVELERAIEGIHFAVLMSHEVLDASTTFDFDTGQITVTVVSENTASDLALDGLQGVAIRKLEAAAGAGILNRITISVNRSKSQVIGVDDSIYHHMGGEDISACTSGFGTRRLSDGMRGISTAGHCDDDQTDDGFGLFYKGGYEGVHGDFQWHTGPKTENDNFYSGSSGSTEVNMRDVSGIGSPVVGQSLCRNGVTSHKDCQEVRKLNVCSGGECNLVQMGADLSAGGDSGGPVFWGRYAYGLHKGEMYDPWPYDRDIFSRADRIDNALGITIATW